MIQSIGQVMLYVSDTKASMMFWTEQVGFVLLNTQQYNNEVTSYTIAPHKNAEVQFVLHDKQWVAKQNPDMVLVTPSILMQCDDIHTTHQKLTQQGVKASPIIEIHGMKTFHFPDNEGHYFAVKGN